MSETKTKSGKTAYHSQEDWTLIKFKEAMEERGISRTSKQYIEFQEIYFIGVLSILKSIPTNWMDKLSKNEPI